VQIRSDGQAVIELIDQAGQRRAMERCDTEQQAHLRALQLADAAARIEARLSGAADAAAPVRLTSRRRERLASYPRITVALPQAMLDWLADQCTRRQRGLSDVVGIIIGERMMRGFTGDDD
jgi:ferric-dicitrate binding protein FerR (iron transport regulator)